MPTCRTTLTLNEILLRRATLEPERRAYSFLVDGETEVTHITYGDLDRNARAIASELREVCPLGAKVLLIHPPGIPFIAAFMACLYAGMTAVPAYPPTAKRARARLQAILKDARPSAVLTDTATDEELAPITIVTSVLDRCPETDWSPPEVDADVPALIQYTSGSTATPKGVIVMHRNLIHNQGIIARAFGHDAGSVILSWLPVYHDMGLTNVLQALYAGIPCVLMSPTHFLQRPARWLVGKTEIS